MPLLNLIVTIHVSRLIKLSASLKCIIFLLSKIIKIASLANSLNSQNLEKNLWKSLKKFLKLQYLLNKKEVSYISSLKNLKFSVNIFLIDIFKTQYQSQQIGHKNKFGLMYLHSVN